jgi:flagellar biosynthesis/type III secretory pathway protein FliH
MPEVSMNVNIEVYCAACGNGLCNQTEFTRGRSRNQPQFRVEPCDKCLDSAKEKGYEEGYTEAETSLKDTVRRLEEEIDLLTQQRDELAVQVRAND